MALAGGRAASKSTSASCYHCDMMRMSSEVDFHKKALSEGSQEMEQDKNLRK